MSDITILHLSDIHFRKKKDEQNKTFRRDVQEKLIEAVGTHIKEYGTPDITVITGDIAFSGKKKEYGEALEFFNKLKEILPEGTPFLAVPGNHDADRNKVDEFLSLHRIVKEGKTGKFLESKGKIKSFINVKFKAFRDFCRQLNPELYPGRDDYFWVKDFENKNVSFLGLNSAWASEGDQDRFHIALGYPQVMAALEEAKKKEILYRVLLLHHPLFNWLEERDTQTWCGEVFNKCSLVLHGHVHVDSASGISTPSDSCISIGANATYTHDGYIGFQVIKVQFLETRVKVRVWPYILETVERVVFLPHYNRWEGQKGKPYFDIETQRPGGEEENVLHPLQIPAAYREWVVEFHSKMEMSQLDPNARANRVPVPLPEVYIPIETVNPFYKPKDEASMKKIGKSELIPGDEEEDKSKEPQYIDIEKLLGRKNFILLQGPAGMGKTTLVKHLAYTITHGQGPVSLHDYLPVIVFLKDLWPVYKNRLPENEAGSGLTFQSLLKSYLETRIPELSPEVVEHYTARRRALFLLDGLDEVPMQYRRGIVELIASFRLQHKDNRFLLTGRPHGIDADVNRHFNEFLHIIEPLDDQKVKTFVSDWFRVVSGQAEGLADVTAAGMIADIDSNPHVLVFTGNPLLLTAVCILYLDNKRLPDQRAELYRRIVDNLICRRFDHMEDPEKVSRIDDYLKLLAFKMQERNVRSFDIGEAKQLLKKIFPQSGGTPVQYNREIEVLFEEIEPRCGLLKRLDEGKVEFFHLTFQEFLAARQMLYMELDYKDYLGKPWWEETILLYTGLVNTEWKDKANRMVKEILTHDHKDADILPRLWLLGAKALRDIQAYKRGKDAAGLAAQKLPAVIESGIPLRDRFEAGEILGILGDRRIKDMPMVKVEAGEFTMGSDSGDEDKKPIHRVYLDEFMICKYPITNEEFQAFIHDNGYENRDVWSPEGWKWKEEKKISLPLYWLDRKWNQSNFPVVGVSWYEAEAFANWLSREIGETYRLPTEAQWEKAARGVDGNEYPWGNEFDKDKCNSFECGLYRTSPVGIFPAGASPCGCLDMAGNVLEWCSDWFEEDYYKNSPAKNPAGPSEGSFRVLRGGCWFFGAAGCGAASRGGDHPGGRDDVAGFRLVRSF